MSEAFVWLVQFGLCFPPSSDFIPETLAELIFRLAVLLSPSDSKILKSAKQAVHAAVSVLKVRATDCLGLAWACLPVCDVT